MINAPDPAELKDRIDRLLTCDAKRFRRLWAYYRNPILPRAVDESASARPYRQAMEWGLPSRITGFHSGEAPDCISVASEINRKEVVIENDIGWRIDTMVDYLFGKPIVLNSAAPDPRRRETIQELLRLIFAQAGGITFLQQLALLGAVHGFVDVLVKFDPEAPQTSTEIGRTQDLGRCGSNDSVPPPAKPAMQEDSASPGASHPSHKALCALARMVKLEIVEPSRALPLLSCDDWRCVDAYAQVWTKQTAPTSQATGSILHSLRNAAGRFVSRLAPTQRVARLRADECVCIQLITKDRWYRYDDDQLIDQGDNSLGEIPLVHIQNLATPFEYHGQSDVDPLIPIQDEINVRLSDRGYRITMQSFKMYLGVGIDNFLETPIAPGRMWHTDNDNAKVIEFGGDGKTFSEDNQIGEMREAMDKISGVTPIVAGALKGRIGRLTSAAALRVTMLALLAKTERKRTSYGNGIARMCELALKWLDRAGVFPTTEEERRVEIHWPSPLPVNELERLDEARAKLAVGVDQQTVLRELGYTSSATIDQSTPVDPPEAPKTEPSPPDQPA